MRWFRLAVAFLKGPHLGSLFALVLAFWNGFVFVGPAVGLGQSDRWEYAGYLFLGTVFSAVYTVFRLTKENRDLRDRLEPKVHVVHERGKKPEFVREATMGNGVIERRHMVGIVNDSGAKILRMRVMPERFEPYVQGVTWLDSAFHPVRAQPNLDGWFDLSVGDGKPTRYVEIFQELLGVPGAPDSVISYIYDSSGLNNLNRYVAGDWVAVELRLEGDMRPYRLKLVARRNHLGWFDVFVGDLDVSTMSGGGGSGYQPITLSVAHTAAPSPSQGA